MNVSFLVPAYNEAAIIVAVLERVAALDLDKQIVVVDDGPLTGPSSWSTGGTAGRMFS
jgi:cellulose synthase/poly-beta-1,6-N-acetylglucosamine synthase-like glycosyltransferase